MHRAVFVDRDGVICRNRDDHVKSLAEFEFLPGALQALGLLAKSELRIVVITNQAIINRGIVPVEAVESIHARMKEAIEQAGGRVDLILYCPHRPDERCDCRKPRPGLLWQAEKELGLDLSRSYLIGDAQVDMEAGRMAGCRRYLVLTGRGRRQLLRCWRLKERGFTVLPNLMWAVRSILRYEQHNGQHSGFR